MSIYYLPIENNVFDGLYKKIMDIDNDILDKNGKYFNRNSYINCFIKMLDDVTERYDKSIYYKHYQLSNCIDSFYRTIMKPVLEYGLEEIESPFEVDVFEKKKNFFSVYSHDSWVDNLYREELLLKYFLMNEKENKYLSDYGIFEISTEKTITPISLPVRDKDTNNIYF
jgi:hypothetical protein